MWQARVFVLPPEIDFRLHALYMTTAGPGTSHTSQARLVEQNMGVMAPHTFGYCFPLRGILIYVKGSQALVNQYENPVDCGQMRRRHVLKAYNPGIAS
jgi:hypothetical protein